MRFLQKEILLVIGLQSLFQHSEACPISLPIKAYQDKQDSYEMRRIYALDSLITLYLQVSEFRDRESTGKASWLSVDKFNNLFAADADVFNDIDTIASDSQIYFGDYSAYVRDKNIVFTQVYQLHPFSRLRDRNRNKMMVDGIGTAMSSYIYERVIEKSIEYYSLSNVTNQVHKKVMLKIQVSMREDASVAKIQWIRPYVKPPENIVITSDQIKSKNQSNAKR